MKTKIALPLVALASLVIIAAVFVFRPLPTTITRANADRLRVGMTVAQVVDILGEPRDETSRPPAPPHSLSASPYRSLLPPPPCRRRWVGESLVITVDSEPAAETYLEGKVTAVDIANHDFSSTWDFVTWRVRRVLGMAPDVPLPVEPVWIYDGTYTIY